MKENAIAMEQTTIAAIATAMSGEGGISIVRISGKDAVTIADRIYRGKEKLATLPSHTIHYGHIVDCKEQVIDEVMVMIMRAPRSYTAEDTIEIDCHGGLYVTQRILETVIKAGAIPAEPGEFTKRAFLNGRIDLSSAEAVIDVINAKNEYALNASVRQLRGSIKRKIEEIRDIILDDVSFLEAGMDDPEHIDLTDAPETVLAHTKQILQELERIKAQSRDGKILKEGIHTVILGKPNAGKSSLLNYLTGCESAIVTDIEGTTRDIVEEHIRLGSFELILSDTAGIRKSDNLVEQIGIEKAIEASKDADCILFVIDSSMPLDDNDRKIFHMIEGRKAIIILNKSDLVGKIDESMIRTYNRIAPIIVMSAKMEQGLEELEESFAKLFQKEKVLGNDQIMITNTRQLYEIEETIASMQLVKNSIEDEMPEDFMTIDLMNAYAHLGNIIGESVEEDMVDRIFEKFCMGK